jgi:hypothetical protein
MDKKRGQTYFEWRYRSTQSIVCGNRETKIQIVALVDHNSSSQMNEAQQIAFACDSLTSTKGDSEYAYVFDDVPESEYQLFLPKRSAVGLIADHCLFLNTDQLHCVDEYPALLKKKINRKRNVCVLGTTRDPSALMRLAKKVRSELGARVVIVSPERDDSEAKRVLTKAKKIQF